MNCYCRLALTVFALGSLCAVRPASAHTPIDEAQITIGESSQRFRRAQLLRANGKTDAALQELDSLRKDFPFDVDYALARAQILAQLQRDDEALDELAIATKLAPDYEDVWKLRFIVLARQQGEHASRDRQALQQEAAIRFPYAEWWLEPGNDNVPRWSLLVGAGHETLSNNLPSWNNQFAELQLDRHAAGRYRFRLGRDERYNEADTTVGLGVERSWSPEWFAGIDLSIAGGPSFQPDLGYGGHIGKSLNKGWVLDFGYRRKEYPTTSVGSARGTVEKYVDDFRIAYGLSVSQLEGASSFASHVLTVNWYYSEKSSIGITVNAGKEAESIGNGQVLETDVHGFSLSGRRELSERFGLLWWLGVHDQGDLYRRRFLGMAIAIRI